MNKEIGDIILNITRSYTVLSCLQLAELTEAEDYSNFSQCSIDILEKYIQSRTSLMDLNARKLYLNEEYLYYPDKFVFTPGIRNRLLKAAKCISKSVYVNVYGSNKSDSAESHIASTDTNNNSTDQYQLMKPVRPNHSSSLNFSDLQNQFLTGNPLIKTESAERVRHIDFLDKYYTDISKNANKNFVNCNLEPKIHFQITIPEDDPLNLTGLFHCGLCEDRRKSATVIKFRFSKYNSVIYTNINAHLKIHFQYILDTQSRKRMRLSKLELDETLPENGLINGVTGDEIVVNNVEVES